MKELCWCVSIDENISDGIWFNPGKRHQCYKENKASFIFWDVVPEADYPTSRSIEPFDEKKRNKNRDG